MKEEQLKPQILLVFPDWGMWTIIPFTVYGVYVSSFIEYLETLVCETTNKVVTCYINLTLTHTTLQVLGQITLFYSWMFVFLIFHFLNENMFG